MRIALFGAMALAVVAPAYPATASPVAPTTPLPCAQVIGGGDPPFAGYAKVLDKVWLPTRRALGSVRLVDPPAPTARWWSKQGLVIKAKTTLTLTVPKAWRGRLAIGWGSPAQPSERVTVAGCDPGGTWLAYAGGYWVSKPACVPLIVQSGLQRKVVHIGVGAACRGQSPPPTYVPAVERRPTPAGMHGTCVRVSVGGSAAQGCIQAPGTSVWRVGDTDLLIAVASLELRSDQTLYAGSSGFVVVPFADYHARLSTIPTCLTTSLIDGVAKHLSPETPPFFVSACSPTYAFVGKETEEPGSLSPTLVFQRRGERWTYVDSVDFRNPDRVQRCASLPNNAQSLCTILGG